MVNPYYSVNTVTFKPNYPMERVEPVVNLLLQEKYKKGPTFHPGPEHAFSYNSAITL